MSQDAAVCWATVTAVVPAVTGTMCGLSACEPRWLWTPGLRNICHVAVNEGIKRWEKKKKKSTPCLDFSEWWRKQQRDFSSSSSSFSCIRLSTALRTVSLVWMSVPLLQQDLPCLYSSRAACRIVPGWPRWGCERHLCLVMSQMYDGRMLSDVCNSGNGTYLSQEVVEDLVCFPKVHNSVNN